LDSAHCLEARLALPHRLPVADALAIFEPFSFCLDILRSKAPSGT